MMIITPISQIRIPPETFVMLIGNPAAMYDAAEALGLPVKGRYRALKVQDATQLSGKFGDGQPVPRVLVHEATTTLSPEQHQAIGFIMANSVPIEYFSL